MVRKLVFALAAAAAAHAAGDSPLDRATLRNLQGVNVVVDPLDPQIEAAVTRADLRERVESLLRAAGIVVDTSQPEFVGVRLMAARGGRRLFAEFALAMTLSFYQPVELVRDPKVRTATQTWEVATVILAAPKVLHQAALDSIEDLTGRLIQAFRAANPPAR